MKSEDLKTSLKTRKEGVEFNPSYLPNLEDDWKDCISEEHRREIQESYEEFVKLALKIIISEKL